MIYGTANIHPVHRLHYAWTGWPTEGTTLPPFPLNDLIDAWNKDGLQLIAHDADETNVMLTFKASSHVSPITLAHRAKGRLQHASAAKFSRKISVRSLGENISDVVEQYIRDQLEHVDLVDPRYRQLLADAAFEDKTVALSTPHETNAGRYWYNLHLVMVTCNRYRVGRPDVVHGLRDHALVAARAAGLSVKAIAVMPDHLHVALRCNPDRSPAEVGVLFQEATARAAGCRLWQENFYVGTFSEYGLDVVRERAQLRSY